MRAIDFFDNAAGRNPDGICLQDPVRKRSFSEVQARTCKIANTLAAEGFGPGAKAGLYVPNCVEAMEVILSFFRAGVAWVPANSKNAVEDICSYLDSCDTDLLFYHSKFEGAIDRVRELCPSIRRFICVDRSGSHGPFMDEWCEDAEVTDPDIPLGPDALLAIMPSGGTTGKPKGIMLSQLNWATMIASLLASVEVGDDAAYLAATPVTHGAGAAGLTLMAGGARVIILPDFDPKNVLDTMEEERVTHLFLPPTAIYMLLSQPGIEQRKFPALRGFLYAAAPMAVDKLRQCLKVFGPVMTQTYGQTEAPMFCTILTAQDHLAAIDDPGKAVRLASCGRPGFLTKVGIMDDDGNLLGQGERGEIVVRGNLVMKGYYKNPEATAEVSQFGWHHTGDIGVIDDDYYLYVVDRKKDMIISGGFNVYPAEVEQVIWSHPAVQDCAVIGVPDEKWGEAVKAVIELKPGASVEGDEIIALCKERLGSVRTPKTVEIWEKLPRTPVGKVSKKDIRAPYWEGHDRMI